jgi:hypothetical protein
MKLNYTSSLLIVVAALLLGVGSCKNDIDVFAPETDVTLIYGLLSADDQIHQFKINRVFQGEDAIENLAKDPKISEYENLNGILFELFDNGFGGYDTSNQWPLVERTITNKDSGYYYYPNQKIYEVTATLNTKREYAIWVDKLNETPIVESKTELIRVTGDILIKPLGLTFLGLGLASNGEPNNNIRLEMNLPINAKVLDVYLDFTWKDEFKSGKTPEFHTISYKVGTYVASSVSTENNTVRMDADLNPTAFYEFIAANAPIVELGSDIKQRVANDVPLKFRFVTGGNEFNTYLEVASPSTSLLETKPEYTNIQNGVGLFSCRNFNDKEAKMSKKSIDYLVNGDIMTGRRFCNYDNSTDPNYCF